MRIAVNAIFLQKGFLEGGNRFVKEIFSRLVKQYPEHEFIFLFNRDYDPSCISGSNVKPIIVKPAARHPILSTYWYEIIAPLALKKYKPDIWVQPYGLCSLTTKLPQLLLVHDLSCIHDPSFFSWHQRWYYKWLMPQFLRKAKQVATVSEYSKKDIEAHYRILAEKISVAYSAAGSQFQPSGWQEKQALKQQYAGGSEYFLCTGGNHPNNNLLNLLKAFSLFKKWQHSNMKLIVAGKQASQSDDILEKLKTYKYRDDVIFTGYLPDNELVKLTASAYAIVCPSWFEGFGVPILEAMQSEVPVIASNKSSMFEVGGDAALYANPGSPDEIAKQMLNLYRDETFRSQLIEAGKIQAAKFSWNTTAALLWGNIEKIVRQSD